MKLETTKTFILIVLIGLSLLLTYGLWTYQPNYDTLSDESLVNEVDIGGKQETKKDIIVPSKMLFHSDGSVYGFADPTNQQQFFRKMQSWTMYNFKTLDADNRKAKDYEVEVVFPSAIPMEILGSIFTFEEEIALPAWSFQRMYFTFQSEKASLKVQFLSESGTQQATAVINDPNFYEELWSKVYAPQDDLSEYMLFNEGSIPIYLPKGKADLKKLSLTVEKIEPKELVNALFPNPTDVTRPNVGSSGNGEIYYTDTQRQMKIFQDKSMEFISPYMSENEQMDPLTLFENSVKNINDHKGWTEDYHLLDMETIGETNRIRYQMYTDGYPVYSGSNLSIVEQEWRDNILTKYQRSLFNINFDSIDSEQIELPSGSDIASYLENSPDYHMDNIWDVQQGYKLNYMDDDTYTPYIILEPAWYMNYNGSWAEIKFGDLTQAGGD